jgi:hypothetical protein
MGSVPMVLFSAAERASAVPPLEALGDLARYRIVIATMVPSAPKPRRL